MVTYGMSVTVAEGFADAERRTRDALAREGFGVLTEIDVAATMKAKLGVDMAPHKILGACNPPLAHSALAIEPSLGLLLPCNVVLRHVDDTHTLVEAMDPRIMSHLVDVPALVTIAEEARERLTAALSAIEAGAGSGTGS